MGRIRWGRVISRSWRLGLKSGQEGGKVRMALGIELLLRLKSTLQRSDLVLELLLG